MGKQDQLIGHWLMRTFA